MKKQFADRSSDVFLRILRPFVEAWMRVVARRTDVLDPGVDFRRREPFVLLANHTFDMDVVHVPMPFRITPHIVASEDLFVDPFERFVLTYVARCVRTTKGKGDVRTIGALLSAVQKGYPILVFPEGDISFFGATGPIARSIAVLVKKLRIDVITCRVAGGHLSSPRWATHRRANRHIQLNYELALTKEDVASSSPREIFETLSAKLQHNDFEYQREARDPHPSPRAAEGLDDVLYACPECGAIHSLVARGTTLRCGECGTEGGIDDLGFIHGFRFEDTVAWDEFQRGKVDELRACEFTSGGELFVHDYIDLKKNRIGRVMATYKNGAIHLEGAHNETWAVENLDNVMMTGRSDLNVAHGETNYILRLESKGMSFLRACQDQY